MHMKVIHITSKVLLKLVEVGIIVIVALSIIPLVAGGLTIDNEPQMTATINTNGSLTISGEVDVSSSLMWDINDLSYYVSVGDENNIVAVSDPVTTSIPKGGSVKLEFGIEVPLVNLALYMVDSGLDQNGNMGTMKVPLQLGIGGHYIQNLVGFDLDVDLEAIMDVDVGSHVEYDEVNDKLTGEITYEPGTELPIPAFNTIVKITSDDGIADGFVKLTDSGSAYVLDFELDGDTNIRNIINGGNLVVVVDGNDIPVEFNSTLTSLINDILTKLGVPE